MEEGEVVRGGGRAARAAAAGKWELGLLVFQFTTVGEVVAIGSTRASHRRRVLVVDHGIDGGGGCQAGGRSNCMRVIKAG
jgi:hypothetical protein